jgi:methylated-DNA-[protein]-cysteine S-methyltransferase
MKHLCSLDSPIGTLTLTAEDDALTGLYMDLFRGSADKRPTFDAGWAQSDDHPLLKLCRRQLKEYFAGRRRAFELPLRPAGSAFQQSVWRELTAIPFGVTRSYGDIARRLGNPNASRAVGLANGRNPIAVIIPCHRVIGADGSLTGFGGGLPRKQWLLTHEGSYGLRPAAPAARQGQLEFGAGA